MTKRAREQRATPARGRCAESLTFTDDPEDEGREEDCYPPPHRKECKKGLVYSRLQ
jgi:hypothetical protein